jgi:hypothetical protein
MRRYRQRFHLKEMESDKRRTAGSGSRHAADRNGLSGARVYLECMASGLASLSVAAMACTGSPNGETQENKRQKTPGTVQGFYSFIYLKYADTERPSYRLKAAKPDGFTGFMGRRYGKTLWKPAPSGTARLLFFLNT